MEICKLRPFRGKRAQKLVHRNNALISTKAINRQYNIIFFEYVYFQFIFLCCLLSLVKDNVLVVVVDINLWML